MTAFQSMTPNRITILEHIAAYDVIASTRALSIALKRDYSAVHSDMAKLVKLGLIERDGTTVRCEMELGRAKLSAT